jgi:hypothetical protein
MAAREMPSREIDGRTSWQRLTGGPKLGGRLVLVADPAQEELRRRGALRRRPRAESRV